MIVRQNVPRSDAGSLATQVLPDGLENVCNRESLKMAIMPISMQSHWNNSVIGAMAVQGCSCLV